MYPFLFTQIYYVIVMFFILFPPFIFLSMQQLPTTWSPNFLQLSTVPAMDHMWGMTGDTTDNVFFWGGDWRILPGKSVKQFNLHYDATKNQVQAYGVDRNGNGWLYVSSLFFCHSSLFLSSLFSLLLSLFLLKVQLCVCSVGSSDKGNLWKQVRDHRELQWLYLGRHCPGRLSWHHLNSLVFLLSLA